MLIKPIEKAGTKPTTQNQHHYTLLKKLVSILEAQEGPVTGQWISGMLGIHASETKDLIDLAHDEGVPICCNKYKTEYWMGDRYDAMRLTDTYFGMADVLRSRAEALLKKLSEESKVFEVLEAEKERSER